MVVPGGQASRACSSLCSWTASAWCCQISVEQAKQAALAAVPGTVLSAQLEDENGNVVYGVEVTTASGTVDVKVDAGTAKVLSQEAGEAGGER